MKENIIDKNIKETADKYADYIENNESELDSVRKIRNEYVNKLSKNKTKAEIGDSFFDGSGFFMGITIVLLRTIFPKKH